MLAVSQISHAWVTKPQEAAKAREQQCPAGGEPAPALETQTLRCGMRRGPAWLLGVDGWIKCLCFAGGGETFGCWKEPCRNRCDAQAEPW